MSRISKSIVSLGLVILFTAFTTLASYAGGSGNCIKPLKKTTDHFALGGGYEFNYVDSRLFGLTNYSGGRPTDYRVRHMWQSYGRLMWGPLDFLNVYANIGGANYDLDFVDKNPDADVQLTLNPGVFTGGGLGAWLPLDFMKCGPVEFGVGGDAMANVSFNEVKDVTRGGVSGTNVTGSLWALNGLNSLYLSAQYEVPYIKTILIPYLGAFQSWMAMGTTSELNYSRGGTNFNSNLGTPFDFLSFGMVFGMDIDIVKYVNVNIEGRVIGETALTTGVTLKF